MLSIQTCKTFAKSGFQGIIKVMGVLLAASVDAFFCEMVRSSLSERGFEASETTEYYLVSLLGEYAKGRISDEPLSLRLAEANRSDDPSIEVQTLKEVGDTSLYVAGFFSESLERKLVQVDYYVGIGRTAYASLAQRLSSSGAGDVYGELSDKFPRFVDVLTGVRSKVHLCTDPGKLFERWKRTGSKALESKLRGLGIVLPSNGEAAVC